MTTSCRAVSETQSSIFSLWKLENLDKTNFANPIQQWSPHGSLVGHPNREFSARCLFGPTSNCSIVPTKILRAILRVLANYLGIQRVHEVLRQWSLLAKELLRSSRERPFPFLSRKTLFPMQSSRIHLPDPSEYCCWVKRFHYVEPGVNSTPACRNRSIRKRANSHGKGANSMPAYCSSSGAANQRCRDERWTRVKAALHQPSPLAWRQTFFRAELVEDGLTAVRAELVEDGLTA